LVMLVPAAGSSRWLPAGLLALALLLLAAALRRREHLEVSALLLPVVAAGVSSGVFLAAELQDYGPTLREWVASFWMLSVIELALVLAGGVLTSRSRRLP
jgi:MYXO-CTERM domain-containing protein